MDFDETWYPEGKRYALSIFAVFFLYLCQVSKKINFEGLKVRFSCFYVTRLEVDIF